MNICECCDLTKIISNILTSISTRGMKYQAIFYNYSIHHSNPRNFNKCQKWNYSCCNYLLELQFFKKGVQLKYCMVIKDFCCQCNLNQTLSDCSPNQYTAIWPCLVKIGLKTKICYHYAKFWQDPFLNCVNSSKYYSTTYMPLLTVLHTTVGPLIVYKKSEGQII